MKLYKTNWTNDWVLAKKPRDAQWTASGVPPSKRNKFMDDAFADIKVDEHQYVKQHIWTLETKNGILLDISYTEAEAKERLYPKAGKKLKVKKRTQYLVNGYPQLTS